MRTVSVHPNPGSYDRLPIQPPNHCLIHTHHFTSPSEFTDPAAPLPKSKAALVPTVPPCPSLTSSLPSYTIAKGLELRQCMQQLHPLSSQAQLHQIVHQRPDISQPPLLQHRILSSSCNSVPELDEPNLGADLGALFSHSFPMQLQAWTTCNQVATKLNVKMYQSCKQPYPLGGIWSEAICGNASSHSTHQPLQQQLSKDMMTCNLGVVAHSKVSLLLIGKNPCPQQLKGGSRVPSSTFHIMTKPLLAELTNNTS